MAEYDPTDPDAETLQRTDDELRRALEECNRKLIQIKKDKAVTNKDYKDRGDDINAEIEGILQQLKK